MTMSFLITLFSMVAIVGTGVVAGLFFAFSAAVMSALRRLDARYGIAAMRSINAAILNPIFGLVFVGTTISAAALAVLAPFGDHPAPWLLSAGGAVFVVGGFGVTMLVNVPLNNALAAQGDDDAEFWSRYLARWTAWNHLRTVAAVSATAMFAVALVHA